MHMKNIHTSLSLFDPYSLQDLKEANLMNRVDTKFLLPISWLSDILAQLKNAYRVLDINGNRVSNYKNQYFDTESLKFYHDHHNGKLNRYKVRHREYVDTHTAFLEVKRKTNQRRTIKTRISVEKDFLSNNETPDFISQTVGMDFSQMGVKQHSGYQRIALANEKNAERLTIDFNLWYALDLDNKIYLSDTCIAELKQSRKSKNSPFYSLKEKSKMSPIKFSKYCIGNALLHKENIKYNRFKPILSKVGHKFNNPTAINETFHSAQEL